MKKKMVVLATLVTLAVAAYLGSQLWAQAPSPAPSAAPAAVKIGLVNLPYVFNGYKKYRTYSDDMEKFRSTYEKKGLEIAELVKKWQDYEKLLKPDQQAEREKADSALKNLKRQVEDLQAEYKPLVQKKSDEHMVQCYKEIEEAVKRYSAANGFHLIFNYSEALKDTDKYSPLDIQRKITGTFNSGGVCPLYFVPGIDISADIVATLNNMFPVSAAAVPATSPAAPGKQ